MEKLLHERLKGWGLAAANIYDIGKKLGVSFDNEMDMRHFIADILLALANEIERCYIPRPRFEDGELVQFGSNEPEWVDTDDYDPQTPWRVTAISQEGIPLATTGSTIVSRAAMTDDKFVKRPTPKVYDADRVEIKVGDTVYSLLDNDPIIVSRLSKDPYGVDCFNAGDNFNVFYVASSFTHERPVFDAEGVRICKRDTVWGTLLHDKHEVSLVKNGCIYLDDGSICFEPTQLTHREPDSLEKLRDDINEWTERNDHFRACTGKVTDKWSDRLTALIERGA